MEVAVLALTTTPTNGLIGKATLAEIIDAVPGLNTGKNHPLRDR